MATRKENNGKGIYDETLKRFVPMPREGSDKRFYVTPVGIGYPKKKVKK